VGRTPRKPVLLVDAVLDWVAGEATRFRASAWSATRVFLPRARDLAVVVLAASPLLVVIAR
jgi:hypothetical protein